MIAEVEEKGNGKFFTKKLLFKALGVGLLVIILVLIVADINIFRKKRELISQIELYKKQIEDIQKNSQTLQEEIANSDNSEYLEEIAYEQLNQQKPGEKVYIFVESEKEQEQIEVRENFASSWLSHAWQWIKNKF